MQKEEEIGENKASKKNQKHCGVPVDSYSLDVESIVSH